MTRPLGTTYGRDSLLAETSDIHALRRARDRLYVLYESSRAVLSRVEDLNDLLDRLKLEVINSLKIDEMIVALKNPATTEVTYDVVNRANRFRATEIDGSKTIIKSVLAGGEPYRREVGKDEETVGTSTSLVRLNVRSAMCAPLDASGDLLGAIYVQNPDGSEGFDDEDFDFLTAFARHVALAVREAFRRQTADRALAEMRHENLALKEGIDPKDPLSTLVGTSEALDEVRGLIQAVQDLPSTVLIVGESGTGKELIAKAIHYGGNRREHPFISVNVAACPEGLLESELFGHEKGAFTGASSRRHRTFRAGRQRNAIPRRDRRVTTRHTS